MSRVLKLNHIRVIAVLIMLIGTFFVTSMIAVVLSHAVMFPTFAFSMFVVGLVAGLIITALGIVLFRHPKLGQWA